MKPRLRTKKSQLIVLLVLLNCLLLFTFILPTREKISYYREKLDTLKIKHNQLSVYSLHASHHKKNLEKIKQARQHLEQQLGTGGDIHSIQVRFGELQRQYHLKVITQKFNLTGDTDGLKEFSIQQNLEGDYVNHMNYLKSIFDSDLPVLLSTCSFVNKTPTETDPLISMTLRITLYQPDL